MPEVIISGKVYSIDPRDFVTEPRLEHGLFSRSQAADGRIPKVRDQKLTGPVTTSVRECMSYHVHGVPHPRFHKPFHILELDIQAMKTIMPSSMLDINSEQYYPDLWSPGQCDPVQPPISDIEFREQSVRLGADLCDGLLKGFSYGLDPTQGGGISGLIPLCKAFQAVSKKFQMHPEAKGFFRRYSELERLCRAMSRWPDQAMSCGPDTCQSRRAYSPGLLSGFLQEWQSYTMWKRACCFHM